MALLDQVQNAGAVFVGPWSPASLGDYIAGPNHVLPTNRTARFSSALRADDFRKHIHAVTVTPDALAALGPPVITLAETEGLPAHADSVRRRLDALALDASTPGRAVSAPPAHAPRPRPDRGLPLAPGRGRGAAQHERVALPAAREVERGAAGRAGRGVVPPLSRPPGHRAAPGHRRAARRHPRGGVLRQRLQRGAAVPPPGLRRAGPARPALRADLRPALAHRRAHRHRGRRGRRATTTSGSTPTRPRDAARRRARPTSPSCARPTTRPAGPSRPTTVVAVLRGRAGPRRRRRGLRAVLPLVRPRPARARRTRAWS